MGTGFNHNFKVSAERSGDTCVIRCDQLSDAEWLREYLASHLPGFQSTEPRQEHDENGFAFQVSLTDRCTAYDVRQAVLKSPRTLPVRLFPVRITEQPHYTIESDNLADWLESQDDVDETWWTVDGDPLLMSRIEFPAPPDELADALRQVDRTLLVADPSGEGSGEEIASGELDKLADSDDWGNRRFVFCWEDSETEWELVEDVATSESSGVA